MNGDSPNGKTNKDEEENSIANDKGYSSALHYEALLLLQRQSAEGGCSGRNEEMLQLHRHLSMLALVEVTSLSKQEKEDRDDKTEDENIVGLNHVRFRDRFSAYIDVVHASSVQQHHRQQHQHLKVQQLIADWDSSGSDVEEFYKIYPECYSPELSTSFIADKEGKNMGDKCNSTYFSSSGVMVGRSAKTNCDKTTASSFRNQNNSTFTEVAMKSDTVNACAPPFTYRLSASSTNSSPDEKHDEPPLQPPLQKQRQNRVTDHQGSPLPYARQVSSDPWQEFCSDKTHGRVKSSHKTQRSQYVSSNQQNVSVNYNYTANLNERKKSILVNDENFNDLEKCYNRQTSAGKPGTNAFLTAKEVSSHVCFGDEGQYPQRRQKEQYEDDPCTISVGPTLSAGLKRKFQPPFRRTTSTDVTVSSKITPSIKANASNLEVSARSNGNDRSSHKANSEKEDDDSDLPEALRGLDRELIQKITSEILQSGDPVTFHDIAGLEHAKQTVIELICWPMSRPDLFTGLRKAPNGLLLYGPPVFLPTSGTGKTLIGKAIANESGATFFSISSSSMTSKWIGEGEKLVRTLFAVASVHEPSVVFIDEIDSLLTQRSSEENEASRRIKTEFLVQLDGANTSNQGRVLIIGATNRPHELDDAARRRFVKRIYVPLPTEADRKCLILSLLQKNNHNLTDYEIAQLAQDTNGFSGADLKALCTDAALGPIRDLGLRALSTICSEKDLAPISFKHFRKALRGTKPSVSQLDLAVYLEFDEAYGTRISNNDSFDDDEEESPNLGRKAI